MTFLTDALTSLKSGLATGPSPNKTALSTGPSSAGIKQRNILPEYACIIHCGDLGITVTAQLPEEFGWGSTASYDTPLKDGISSVVNMIPGAPIIAGVARAAGMSLMTQTLSARVWGGSSSDPISLNLIFQANTDEMDDVLKPLIQLMALTVPHNAGGTNGSLLSAPGPYLDLVGAAGDAVTGTVNTLSSKINQVKTVAGQQTIVNNAVSSQAGNVMTRMFGFMKRPGDTSMSGQALNSLSDTLSATGGMFVNEMQAVATGVDSVVRGNVRNKISIRIGNYMMFGNVVITGVQQTHKVQPVGKSYGYSSGVMQRVEANITFEPFFDITLNELGDVFLDPRVKKIVEDIVSKHANTTPPVR